MYNESLQLDVLRGKINIEYEPSLYEACSTLCLRTFEKFKVRFEEAKDYAKQVQSINCVAIKSLKHPDAPARMCHRISPNHTFTCKTCEVTIAHEEQCVHSIVANDMMYIKEQFDERHYKREFVSSQYTNHNKDNRNSNQKTLTEIEESDYITIDDSSYTSNDFDLNGNLKLDNEIGFEADNDFTKSEKQASYYEQQCNHITKIKPMNVTELRKTFNEILSSYETCTEQMKLVVNSLALSLNEIALTDGQATGIFRHVERDKIDQGYASKQIVNILKKHNNSFLPIPRVHFKRNRTASLKPNKILLTEHQHK